MSKKMDILAGTAILVCLLLNKLLGTQGEQPYNAEIRKAGEDGPAYPGYSYGVNSYVIPYGTLYHILKEEGFEVTGDWKSFQFVGIDGITRRCTYLGRYGVDGNGGSHGCPRRE